MKFSERYSYEKPFPFQRERIDEPLKNRLWNQLYDVLHYFLLNDSRRHNTQNFKRIINEYWGNFFKLPVDEVKFEIPKYQIKETKNQFFEFSWYRIYDFLEFSARIFRILDSKVGDKFIQNINLILKQENAAYRFVGNEIIEIVSEIEIEAIKNAIEYKDEVSKHLNAALKHLSDKIDRDPRQSCRESISAVEALARKVTGENKAVLSSLCNRLPIHQQFQQAIKNLYNYTSDESGVRHALTEQSQELYYEDALFMLTICSALINYVRSKDA